MLKVVIPFSPPQYMNSAALSEIAGELLVTVRELREELLQVRDIVLSHALSHLVKPA